ncbi:hypothetical protein [Priestia flexa]|uniref:hypothetical protein n=1 Tax=Priestia flexa TaxID=86664 RepID=UPI0004739373|nr:hypothetical protein [Priestia flexa]
MAEFDFGGGGGGGGTLKKLGKNKTFLMLAVGVGVIGVIVMMKRQSAASSSQVTEGEAEGYPNAYNTVDTVAQMQNMQSILAGQQESMFNQFIAEYQQDISQVQTDIGEATKEQVDTKIDALKKEIAKKDEIHATVQTDFFKEKWKANYIYKTMLSNGAANATVKQASNGSYYVEAGFQDPNKADAAAQNAIKQTSADKRIGFKNYSKTVK